MRRRCLLFIGPSLRCCDFVRIDQAEVEIRQPIRRGDIPRAIEEGDVGTIAIIDGDFFQHLAVSPKEILAALRVGITVLGGGSMGAMRAAELDTYGMHGIGVIYEWYRNRFLSRDDDVAIAYSRDTDTSYQLHSLPMVNVIWATLEAKCQGWLSPQGSRRLLRAARRIHWSQRTWASVLRNSVLKNEEREALLSYVKDPNHDLKRLDALAMIEHLKRIS
jgi:hypothetical protein